MSMKISELSTKEMMVREWVRRKLGSVEHEERVTAIARTLFGLTRRWHGLGAAECNLLVMGTLVHDVGRSQGDDNHARGGAAMVLENESLKLTAAERRRMGFLTQYHRGRVPVAGKEEILEAGADDRGVMRVLLGILRAADSLDSRACEPPRLVVTVKGRVLTIYGYMEGDAAEQRLGKRKKLKLMEEELGCAVRTEWFGAEGAAMVG